MTTTWNHEQDAASASPFSEQFGPAGFGQPGPRVEQSTVTAMPGFDEVFSTGASSGVPQGSGLLLAHESPFESGGRWTASGPASFAEEAAGMPSGDIWVPGAELVSNPRSAGGTYVDAPWRFVVHTIEGEPNPRAFRELAAGNENPPHLWAMASADLLLQTIPLNRSAYALARSETIQTNRLRAVQVQLWGYAAKMGDVGPDVIAWLADRVLGPVARLVPINLDQVSLTGPGEACHGEKSPCRMTAEQWQVFNGVTGHNRVPGNKHGDPGRLDLGAIAARTRARLGSGQVSSAPSSATSSIRRERASDHDGPGFLAERDDGTGPYPGGLAVPPAIAPSTGAITTIDAWATLARALHSTAGGSAAVSAVPFQRLTADGFDREAPAATALPTTLALYAKVPNMSETEAVGAISAKILRGTPAFATLVSNTNPDIVFKDEEATGADRLMTTTLRDKLATLATLVTTEWPGKKLRVTEAWDENSEHAATSTHYEGRAADLTVSDLDAGKLGRLARLAVDAGLGWVFYENSAHVHVSVKK